MLARSAAARLTASAALQSAAIGACPPGRRDERVARAQAVIRQIVDSLDNTLAATALLKPARGKLDPRRRRRRR